MRELPVTDPASFPSAFDEALNTGNLDRLLKLYEPQASFRASDGSVKQGREALQEEMQGLISAQARLHNKLRQVVQSGETALIIVDWHLEMELPGVGHIENKGTATNVIRYVAEAGWRMLIANPQGSA